MSQTQWGAGSRNRDDSGTSTTTRYQPPKDLFDRFNDLREVTKMVKALERERKCKFSQALLSDAQTFLNNGDSLSQQERFQLQSEIDILQKSNDEKAQEIETLEIKVSESSANPSEPTVINFNHGWSKVWYLVAFLLLTIFYMASRNG